MIHQRIFQIVQKPNLEILSRCKNSPHSGYFNQNIENEKHRKTIELNLDIFNEPVFIQVDVTHKMIRLSEIVPLAQELSSKISTMIQTKLIDLGITIPCRKGCSACCGYLVPLSVPETFRLREEFLAMPENTRKAVLNSFLSNARKILEEKPEDLNLLEPGHLSEWYSRLELNCPLLSDNICSIYDKRPIACREHIVKGSELFCEIHQESDFNKADLPVSVLESLGQLCSELEHTEIEAIIMPLAIPWAEENLERNLKTWPALEVIQRLTEIIKESSENLAQTMVQ